jgi:hypothetical protein
LLIALLYLLEIDAHKDKSGQDDFDKFNKRDVIVILLMHEFGTAQVGDTPNSMSKFKKEQDNICNASLFLALWSNTFAIVNESNDPK